MRAGLREIAARASVPATVTGYGSVFALCFLDEPVATYDDVLRNDEELFVTYRRELARRGVFEIPENLGRSHLMYSHTDADVDHALEAAEQALRAALDRQPRRATAAIVTGSATAADAIPPATTTKACSRARSRSRAGGRATAAPASTTTSATPPAARARPPVAIRSLARATATAGPALGGRRARVRLVERGYERQRPAGREQVAGQYVARVVPAPGHDRTAHAEREQRADERGRQTSAPRSGEHRRQRQGHRRSGVAAGQRLGSDEPRTGA